MQQSQILAQLRERGELLLTGSFAHLVEGYTYPLPIFLGSSQLVIQSPQHARNMFHLLREALVDRGVVSLRPTISAMDLPRAGRFRVWVDWHEIAYPAEGTRMSQAIYYFRKTEFGIRTEMVSYTRLSMPEIDSQFAALALTA